MEEKNFSGRFFTIECDLTNETDILNAFKWIDENIGAIHFMINNAGIIRISKILGKITITTSHVKNICISQIQLSINSKCDTYRTDQRSSQKMSLFYHLLHLIWSHQCVLPPSQFKTYKASSTVAINIKVSILKLHHNNYY